MADFGTIPAPNTASPLIGLQAYAATNDAINKAQVAQQDMADRATLRGLSSDLASPDPSVQRQAAATAATLPQAGGNHSVAAINAMNADQRTALGNTLDVTGRVSSAILSLPDADQPAAWDRMRPYMVQAGAVNTPVEFPGKAALHTHFVSALGVKDQIEALGAAQVPIDSSDTTLNLRRPPGTSVLGTQPQAGGAAVAPASGSMIDRARAIHDGLVQRGMDSATALPMAASLLGESGGNPATVPGDGGASQGLGQWNGPRLAAFKAQNNGMLPAQAGLGRQLDFIKWEWDNTHKGAATATNAQATPEGKLGEIVRRYEIPANPDSDVAKRTGYLRQLQAAGIGAAPVQAAATPAAPGAPAPLQVAGPGAPTGGSAPQVLSNLRAGQAAPPAGPAPMSSYVAPGGQPPSTLAPLAAPAPAVTFTRPLGKPGFQPAGPPGFALGVNPQGQMVTAPLPGTPPVVAHNRDGTISLLDPATHQSAGSVQVPAVETLLHDDPASPRYHSAYAEVLQKGAKVGADGQLVKPDMSMYRPPMVVGADGKLVAKPDLGAPAVTNLGVRADYEKDAKEVQGIADAGQQAQASQVRLNLMRDLAARIASGAGGTSRAEWTNFAQTYMPALSPAFVKAITGIPDAAIPQEFAKLALQSAGTQERGVLGSRGGYQAMRLFQSANPGLDLRPDANRRILNMQLVGAQADADYAQGAMQHHNQQLPSVRADQGYTPLSHFDQQWQAQRNPQAYAAAIGVMNGDPVEKVFMGLRPDEQARAIAIAQRADPGAKPSISGDAGFHLLPSGTVFTGPDKKTRTKP